MESSGRQTRLRNQSRLRREKKHPSLMKILNVNFLSRLHSHAFFEAANRFVFLFRTVMQALATCVVSVGSTARHLIEEEESNHDFRLCTSVWGLVRWMALEVARNSSTRATRQRLPKLRQVFPVFIGANCI